MKTTYIQALNINLEYLKDNLEHFFNLFFDFVLLFYLHLLIKRHYDVI